MVTDYSKDADNLPPSLWIIAGPIGNLADLSKRAVQVLQSVDEILAEDTRHSRRLLDEYAITAAVSALHEHNETARLSGLIEHMQNGRQFALLSDAGTPLISDPGYRLVRACGDAGLRVSTVPGACAAVAALSVAGMASDQFHFYGFLPGKAGAREQQLQTIAGQTGSLVFYESPRRLLATLETMCQVLGEQREACLCRELTKQFETVKRLPLGALKDWISADNNQQRGEIVLLVAGKTDNQDSINAELAALYRDLASAFPPAKVAAIMARHLPVKKASLYALHHDQSSE